MTFKMTFIRLAVSDSSFSAAREKHESLCFKRQSLCIFLCVRVRALRSTVLKTKPEVQPCAVHSELAGFMCATLLGISSCNAKNEEITENTVAVFSLT